MIAGTEKKNLEGIESMIGDTEKKIPEDTESKIVDTEKKILEGIESKIVDTEKKILEDIVKKNNFDLGLGCSFAVDKVLLDSFVESVSIERSLRFRL